MPTNDRVGTDAAGFDRLPLLGGRYRVTALLGTGGLGSVYRAVDELLEEEVAVKVLRGGVLERPEAQRRLIHQVRRARRVSHRSVVRLSDVGEHFGLQLLSMEYVDGVSLSHLSQRLEPRRAAALGLDVARGLAAAHEAGVVHGDLKPANVLCARDRAVLTDFGLARALGPSRDADARAPDAVDYLSPEELQGAPFDARADVYALGCILYELVTGEVAWARRAEPLARVLSRPPDPRRVAAEVPGALAEVIVACMATRPEDRLPNGQAVADALLAVCGGAPLHAPRAPAARPLGPGAQSAARSVAVLPLDNLGVMADDYLAFGLAEQLTDDLSRHAALRVRPFAASCDQARREPGAVAAGRALRVDAVVDGTLARTGDEVTLTVRMTSVGDGFQLLAWRSTLGADEVATLASDAAAVLAQALMVDEPPRHAPIADAVAGDLYLRGRYTFASSFYGIDEAIPLLRAAYARAPRDARIASTYALALIRHVRLTAPDASERAEARAIVVETAERHPEAPDAQTALGALLFEDGEYRSAALALARALTLAPSHASALDWAGRMLLDFGRPEWAYDLLLAAREHDPSLVAVEVMIARARFLLGDREGALAALRRRTTPEDTSPLHWTVYSRLVLWTGDRDLAAVEYDRYLGTAGAPEGRPRLSWGGTGAKSDVELRLWVGTTGYLTEEETRAVLEGLPESGVPRRDALLCQLAIEVLAAGGRCDDAARLLVRLERAAFVDVTWLDACPLLEPLRARPEFGALRAAAAARVAPAVDVLDGARALFEPGCPRGSATRGRGLA